MDSDSGPGPIATFHVSATSAGDLPRRVGLWQALGIMVGIIIGSGIFRTPPEIAGHVGSPVWVIAFWLLGGLLSLCGALTYAELATMFPHSGGIYVFLREGLGPVVAFVFGWTYMLISKPLAAAGIAVIFGEHLNTLLGTEWDHRYATCAILIVLTVINTLHVQLGGGLAVFLTALKVAALLAIIAAGVAFGAGGLTSASSSVGPASLLTAFIPVMSAVLWTYDGWSDVAAISGEIREPRKNIPRTLLLGTLLVVGLYVAVNLVYMAMVPLQEMSKLKTVAPVVMERLLGSVAGTAVTVIILISTLGSTHGSILTGARITFAQARDGLLFQFLGRIHPTFATPAVSLWTQLILSCIATIFVAKFEKLVGGFTFTMWIFYGLAAVSVIVLRYRRPDLERPYRCWGFPLVPGLFILASISMTVLAIRADWEETGKWLLVLAAGVPVYFLWQRFRVSSVGVSTPG